MHTNNSVTRTYTQTAFGVLEHFAANLFSLEPDFNSAACIEGYRTLFSWARTSWAETDLKRAIAMGARALARGDADTKQMLIFCGAVECMIHIIKMHVHDTPVPARQSSPGASSHGNSNHFISPTPRMRTVLGRTAGTPGNHHAHTASAHNRAVSTPLSSKRNSELGKHNFFLVLCESVNYLIMGAMTMHMCVCACVCVCVCIYIYIYIYSHTHSHKTLTH